MTVASESSIALETRGLTKDFGGFRANSDVSIAVRRGSRHALIGPNGAGKTTFVNLLTGVLSATAGSVLLGGEDVTRASPQARVRKGMARTFQINQLFADLTPLETVALAVSERLGTGAQWWRRLGTRSEVVDEAAELLTRMRLGDVMTRRTAQLPYGKQRLLEMAAALACRPQVLLLDEPAAGVPEDERHEILDMVEALPAEVTVVLIEHDMELVFSFADRISVLVQGALFTEGTVDEIARDPRVRTVYLGEEVVHA
ncbi:ABC transporter ATP-binding protein [Arenibaculum pallidiluteum]|uniref:ABC transporter ATP-binding protein n=1 Tax=Arenibaculum pallidiluteum TaxID=2812559 RepID=UPI001A976481|nr:ABC transporter ATP-binding protein [Arenibaculum pallidiluteum]